MLQIKKILFPTDYSECAEHAFRHAAHLAGWHRAELHIVNVVEQDETAGGDLPEGLHINEEDLADQLHRALEVEGPPRPEAPSSGSVRRPEDLSIVQEQLVDPSAAEGILRYAGREGGDLVVMGTHGRRGADRMLLGSVAEEVVRRSECPTLTVGARTDLRPPQQVERILVPVDFSKYARLSIAYAVELAMTYGARLDLLHIVEDVELPGAYGMEASPFAVEDIVGRAEKALEEMIRQEIGFEHVLAEVRIGYPAVDIVETAREHEADLIVMATHGRRGIRRLIMGSVAERVVRMAPCPVFSVKSFGKSLLSASAEEVMARSDQPEEK